MELNFDIQLAADLSNALQQSVIEIISKDIADGNLGAVQAIKEAYIFGHQLCGEERDRGVQFVPMSEYSIKNKKRVIEQMRKQMRKVRKN